MSKKVKQLTTRQSNKMEDEFITNNLFVYIQKEIVSLFNTFSLNSR